MKCNYRPSRPITSAIGQASFLPLLHRAQAGRKLAGRALAETYTALGEPAKAAAYQEH